MKNILIADDSSTARMFIRKCMEIAGCREDKFLEAANGEEALDVMRKTSVDMVVTDLNMPVMDGEELLRQIRKSKTWKNIPVLIITSAQNQAKEDALKEMEASAVLAKPISPARMVEVLRQL